PQAQRGHRALRQPGARGPTLHWRAVCPVVRNLAGAAGVDGAPGALDRGTGVIVARAHVMDHFRRLRTDLLPQDPAPARLHLVYRTGPVYFLLLELDPPGCATA